MISKRIFAQIREVRLLLALTVGLGLAGGLVTIFEASFLSRIVNRAFLGHAPLSRLIGLFVWLLVAIALRALVGWFSEVFALRVALKVKESLRDQLIRRLFQLGPIYLRGERTGEVASTVIEGIESLEVYLARYIPQIALSALVPLTILAFVIPNDWVTAIIFVVTWPLIPYFMMLIGRQAEKQSKKQFRTLSHLSAHFLDVLQGISTLKLFHRSRYQLQVIRRISNQYRKTTMDTLRVAFLSALALELLTTLSTAIVAVFIGLRLIAGTMNFQDAFFVLLLAPEFYLPIRLLGTQFHAGMNGVMAADRIFELLDVPVQSIEGNHAEREVFETEWETIQFDHVTYSYREAEYPALSELDLKIHRGEKVALVGPTGAGKSTIMNLLLGLMTATDGIIRIDSQPLTPSIAASWRKQITYLPQHPHLLKGTIADNLRLASPECSFEIMIEAARKAGAHDFISQLPYGYDTMVGENGVGLSGGQIQRIALARAFLKDSPLILLDEPTANLDPESEMWIEQALRDLFKEKTVLVIAHRLSTISRMDRILVLNEGKMIDQGHHTELLSRKGLYHKMLTTYVGERGNYRDQNPVPIHHPS